MDQARDNSRIENSAIERALCATSAELHLQQYPAFHLTPIKPTDNCITFSETIREGELVINRQWSVYTHPAFGWPGEHEAEVWRSIEHIMHLRRLEGTLRNPLETSLAEIREHMAGKGKGGTDLKRIIHALSCLRSTVVKSSFFYYSGGKCRDTYEFSLLASIGIKKKTLANGRQIIDRLTLELPDEIFKNIQNHYIRPLDKGFRDDLGKWISKRLYELLGVKFYALQKKKEPYRTRYSRLCALVGITCQTRLSWAKRVLSRAHNELESKGFLSKVEWYSIRNDSHDWVLCYWPGQRAKAEWKKDYWREVKLPEILVVESLPEIDPEPVWVDELVPNETLAAAALTSNLVEQPFLPFELEAPSKSSFDAFLPKVGAIHPPLDEDYIQMTIEAFEEGSGSFRKLAQLTKKERDCLKTWQECLVNRSDIIEGTKEAIKKHLEKASRSGKPMEPIVSLAYVSGHVMDASKKRQSLEWLERDSTQKARARQTRDLQDREVWLKQQLQKQPGLLKAFYQEFLEPLILVEANSNSMVLASPLQDCASFFHSQGFVKSMSKLCNCPVYVSWVVSWIHGPTWKKQISGF